MSSNTTVFGGPVLALVGALAGLPDPAGAQPMYKCLQGSAVTYSNTACEQLGLKSAGVVQDRITTMPLGAPVQTKGPSAPGKPQSTAGKENQIDMPKTSAVKPVNPLIEKLAK
jgi:hypothetical protein